MRKLTDDEKQRRSLLGCRIKVARLIAGCPTINAFTSRYFTKDLDQMLAQWETGRRLPNDEVLKKISQHCQVNYQWIKTGEGNMLKGVKSKSEDATKKKAIAGFELLARQYAHQQEQSLPPTDLERSLANYGEGAALILPSAGKAAIGDATETLLAAVLEEVLAQTTKRTLPIDAKKISAASIKLCKNIAESTDDASLQLQMVKPVVGACEWLFCR